MSKPLLTKQAYERDLWLAYENGFTYNDIEVFVKREVLPGDLLIPWAIQPPIIAARCMAGTVYQILERQVYQMPEMIKMVDHSKRTEYIVDRMKKWTYIAETDFSKYDASQWVALLDLENELVKVICPDCEEGWLALTGRPNWITSKNRFI